jgi:hypothetical protein
VVSCGLNAYSVKLTNKVLVALTFAKIIALFIVIIGKFIPKNVKENSNLEGNILFSRRNRQNIPRFVTITSRQTSWFKIDLKF